LKCARPGCPVEVEDDIASVLADVAFVYCSTDCKFHHQDQLAQQPPSGGTPGKTGGGS